jgi:hypothetical protein
MRFSHEELKGPEETSFGPEEKPIQQVLASTESKSPKATRILVQPLSSTLTGKFLAMRL